MNRTIKFRAWDDLNKKWLLGYEYPNLGGFSMFGEVMAFGEYCNMLSSFKIEDWDKIKLMQFTGLTDKNGKEVYEGDVNDKGEILKWNVIHNCFGWFTQGGFKRHVLSDVYDNKGEITTPHISEAIVGNIHENPELLS